MMVWGDGFDELMNILPSAGGLCEDESFGSWIAKQKRNPIHRIKVLTLMLILLDEIVVGKIRKENDACKKRIEMRPLSPIRHI